MNATVARTSGIRVAAVVYPFVARLAAPVVASLDRTAGSATQFVFRRRRKRVWAVGERVVCRWFVASRKRW